MMNNIRKASCKGSTPRKVSIVSCSDLLALCALLLVKRFVQLTSKGVRPIELNDLTLTAPSRSDRLLS